MRPTEPIDASLKRILEQPSESECLEFKEARNTFDFNKLGKYFSALSNEANLKKQPSAWLILGVSDQPPRKLIGTAYKSDAHKLQELKQQVAEQSNGITFQEIHELPLDGKRILLFQIPPATPGIPTSWQGHYYGRHGESLGALSVQEFELLRRQGITDDWSAVICPEAVVTDLDENALNIAVKQFADKHRHARFNQDAEHWEINTFLDKAQLSRKGKITRAAILLLGKPESAHHLTPHPAQITWRLTAEEQAYEHFGPPFLVSVETLYQRIRNLRFRFQPDGQLIPIEMEKYDKPSILEALNNCIAHQDYTQSARIVITEEKDQLTFRNIGSFFEGSLEDYVLHQKTPEHYRNPLLARAMVQLNMIDTMGMGIRRMYQEQQKRFFPMPEYDLSETNHVQMTLLGKVVDPRYTQLLIAQPDLMLEEVFLLDKIQKGQRISTEAKRLLRKKHLIEGKYANIYIAKEVAQAINEKAQYTKNKAFDQGYYQDLLLQFLDQHGEATPKDIAALLMDKLPEQLGERQKKNAIRNLLQKMVKNHLIYNQGARGYQARWRKS